MKELVQNAKEAGLSERRACVLLDVSRAGVRKRPSGGGSTAEIS